MKYHILASLLMGITGACFAKPFPLCMYGVNDPADLPLLKKAGFSCIQTYQKAPEKLAALARAAQKQDMQVIFYPNQILGSSYESQARHWPVLAWYLVDEPDVAKWSRERVLQVREQTRTAFPHHANALVIGQGKTRIPYYDLPDNLMMDWYPVPHLALTSFGDNVRWAKEGQRAMSVADRPLWGVVQIFDWKEFKQYRPDHDRIGRFPTQAEIRFMSYDALLNGASGLFYFIFTTKDKPLPKAQPQWWNRVTAVSRELALLRPVLEKGTLLANPIRVEPPLALQTYLYKKHLYFILLNRSDKSVAVPDVFLTKHYQLVGKDKKNTQLFPYGVWVLKRAL